MSADCPNAKPREGCEDCPGSVMNIWRLQGSALRTELRRHDLTFRERLIAELILDKTYGWQRREIVFPQLRTFKDLTGIGEPDVVKVLRTLHARRVIRIQTVKGHPTYSINPDAESWKALPRLDKQTMQSTINVMREHNGLELMPMDQEAALNFKNCPHTNFPAAVIGNLPMGEQTGEFPNLY